MDINLISVLLVCSGLAALFVGGELLVRAAVGFGRLSGLSNLVIGLTLVAFGTSAPELAVSVDAAIQGIGEIALANVVGSNLANIALVLAMAATLKPITIDAVTLKRDLPVMLLSYILFAGLLLDHTLGRVDGLVLISCLIAYTVYIIKKPSLADNVDVEDDISLKPVKLALLFIIGIGLLVAGGHWLVSGAVDIASSLGVSEAVIGVSIVAIGTSLPEITASVIATLRGHSAMALGAVVGSNIWNSLGVLGATSIITPVSQGNLNWHMLLAMALVGVLVWVFCRTKYVLSRSEGWILLLGYVAYQVWLFV